MWYLLAPGSGIFYQSGVTATAPTKLHMLKRLLSEWVTSASVSGQRAPFAKLRFASDWEMLDALRSVGNGSKSCHEAGVPKCYDDQAALPHELKAVDASFTLMDHWDMPIIDMARKLSYDTLLFTSSFLRPDCNSGDMREFRRSAAELVDLRLPKLHRSPEWASLDNEAQSAALVHELQASGRLTLRDPYDPAGSPYKPCIFNSTPTEQLACHGHVSWHQTVQRRMSAELLRSCSCGEHGYNTTTKISKKY